MTTAKLHIGLWIGIDPRRSFDLKEEREDGTVVYREAGASVDTLDDRAEFLKLVLGPVKAQGTWGKR